MNQLADRNLLLGILALQMEFVSRDALITAMHAWVLDKQRSLGSIMVANQHLADDARAVLDALVDKHIQMHHGDPARSLASLSLPPSVRQQIASIDDPVVQASLAPLSGGPSPPSDPAATPTLIGTPTSAGMRFKILRPHAKGGLGEVFVAHDVELHREVALKEIQPHRADDRESRSRFVLEAEITGGLEHPGVVPVYGLGFYENGRPFYAMRLIKGDSLKDAISRFHARRARSPGSPGDPSGCDPLPSPAQPADAASGGSSLDEPELLQHDPAPASSPRPSSASRHSITSSQRRSRSADASGTVDFRKLLGRFIDVCDAIEYAHSRGIVHRDLKPDNIMVGKYGETLVVDWGLAKPLGQDPSRNASEAPLLPSPSSTPAGTMAGATVGTPAYMSPEQAAGRLDLLGPASDVYSLGVTLYTLLTGRDAFQRDALDVILRKVQAGDFAPPRAINPGLPRGLEAVCLKAMALDPADRYRSPRALADEIERWLAGEPVLAWPEPWSVRSRRWLTRHQTAAAGVLAASIVAASSFAIAALLLARANEREHRAAQIADSQRFEARKQRDEAARQRDKARRQSIEARKQRDRAEANFRLAQGAVNRYLDRVAQQRLLDEPGLQPLRHELLTTALDFYQQFVRQADGLEPTEKARRQADLGHAYLRLGQLTAQIQSEAHAVEHYERAGSIFTSLAAAEPSNKDFKRGLAQAYARLGMINRLAQRPDQGEELLKKARDLWNELDGERNERSITLTATAFKLIRNGQLDEARQAYEDALALQEQIAADNPDDANNQAARAITSAGLANLVESTDPTRAEALLGTAQDLWTQLQQQHPDVLAYRISGAAIYMSLGEFFSANRRNPEALAAFQKAADVYGLLARDNPASAAYQGGLASAQHNVGVLEHAAGRYHEAEIHLKAALPINIDLVNASPTVIELQGKLARTHSALGSLYSATGRHSQALAAHDSALRHRSRIAVEFPDVEDYQREAASSLIEVALEHHTLGSLDAAHSALRQGIEIYQKLHDQAAGSGTLSPLAAAHRLLGDVCADWSRIDDAANSYRRAVELLSSADGTPDAGDATELVAAYLGLARTHQAAGRLPQAEQSLRQSLDLAGRLADEQPAWPDRQSLLSDCQVSLSQFHQAHGDLIKAQAAWERALDMQQALVRQQPDTVVYQRKLATTKSGLAQVNLALGRVAQADQLLQQSLAACRELQRQDPHARDHQVDLAAVNDSLAFYYQATGQPAQAEAALQEAVDLSKQLARDYPEVPLYRHLLAQRQATLADFWLAGGHDQAAEFNFQQALDSSQRLSGQSPHAAHYRRGLALAHGSLGLFFAATSRPELAQENLQRSLDIHAQLSHDSPASVEHRGDLARAWHQLGHARHRAWQFSQARQALEQSRDMYQRLLAAGPSRPDFRSDLASNYTDLGLVHVARGDLPAAQDAFQFSLNIRRQLLDEQPGAIAFREQLGTALADQGYALSLAEKHVEAESACLQGISIHEALVRGADPRPSSKLALGHSYGVMAELIQQRGDDAAALTWYAKAADVLEQIVRDGSLIADARQYLARVLGGQAEALAAMNRHGEVQPLIDRALDLAAGNDRVTLTLLGLAAAAHLGGHDQAARQTQALMEPFEQTPAHGAAHYAAACVYAAAAGAVANDESLTPDDRTTRSDDYARRALEFLSHARQAGFLGPPAAKKQLTRQLYFESLRQRADYRQFELSLFGDSLEP